MRDERTRSETPRWRRRPARITLIVLAVGVFISQWVAVITHPEGDFALHWLFGWRLRHGAFLYADSMHLPYPPFWAVVTSTLTLLPSHTMKVILYPLGLAPLVLLLILLHRLTRPRLPLAGSALFGAFALGIILTSRFLIRELQECGANLMIVALAWGGVFLWSRRRDALGGMSLGAATALKCTPALFIAYFAWKRQWRMAGYSTAFSTIFLLCPILGMGPSSYVHHMRFWARTVAAGLSEPHPVRGVLGDDEPYNVALRPALGRYLVHLAPGHKGYPWRLDLLDLSPRFAGFVVKGLMGMLLLGIALKLGRSVPARDHMAIVWECAIVSLLMLLYSPITWRQHCVGVLPACFLLARTKLARGLPRGAAFPLAFYVVTVLVLDRGVIGPTMTLRLDSLGITAWALLALLIAALRGRDDALLQHRESALLRRLMHPRLAVALSLLSARTARFPSERYPTVV